MNMKKTIILFILIVWIIDIYIQYSTYNRGLQELLAYSIFFGVLYSILGLAFYYFLKYTIKIKSKSGILNNYREDDEYVRNPIQYYENL